MIRFFSVNSFRSRLKALLKVKRGVYSGVNEAICNSFRGVSIEQVRQNRDMILMTTESIVIKLRMPDKKQKQLDITDGETNRLVKEFFAEFEKDTLVAHDINDNLKEK